MSNRAFLIPLFATALLACSSSSTHPDGARQDSNRQDLRAGDLLPTVDGAPDSRRADGAAADGPAADGAPDQGPTCSPWTLEIIDNAVTYDTSIAVDDSGRVHVSYSDAEGDKDLRYANRPANGVWSKSVVDSAGDLGAQNEIAVDGNGVHIVYGDVTNVKLKYAFRASNQIGWTKSTLDSSNASSMEPSLIADGKGTVHVIYHGTSASQLKYAFRSGSSG
jgi:hypothetical protein